VNETWRGALVGFVAGTGLTLLVSTVVFGSSDNDAYRHLGFMLGIMGGPAVGVIGALIGAYVSSERDLRNRPDGRMNHRQHCDSY
jgi:hypothetical protein